GLSVRLSGFYWDARGLVEQLPLKNPMPGQEDLISFQNVGRIVSEGVEAEGSYRNSAGWYAFGGGGYSRVGSSEAGAALAFGNVVNAPAFTAAAGVSTPRLGNYVHVSGEVNYIS